MMKYQYKFFLICPVRGISEEYKNGIEEVVIEHEQFGPVYWPYRDTDQKASSLAICEQNLAAMRDSEIVLFAWDGKSQGCLFDLGMAFVLNKCVKPIRGYVPPRSATKSFQNFVYELAGWQEGARR